MSVKEELQKLVDVLSDYECGHLLNAVQDIASGERFWESDIGILYNEYVKARYFNVSRNLPNVIPAGLVAEEGIFAPIPIVKSYAGASRVELPRPERISATFSETLLRRRSRRDYTGESISLGRLSTLLQHACGSTDFVAGYGYTRLPLRSFPSAGGLQAPEVYLAAVAVDGLPPGLYHYYPVDHVLESLKPGDYGQTLRGVALGQPYIETSAVVFVITGYYERLRWKYGERAYRYMCMDAGFLGENLCLAAEALGLGACAIAGFIDDVLEELCGINGQDEMVLLLMTVGVPRNPQ
jgi:SagB-type dehydrogenase family enzyme